MRGIARSLPSISSAIAARLALRTPGDSHVPVRLRCSDALVRRGFPAAGIGIRAFGETRPLIETPRRCRTLEPLRRDSHQGNGPPPLARRPCLRAETGPVIRRATAIFNWNGRMGSCPDPAKVPLLRECVTPAAAPDTNSSAYKPPGPSKTPSAPPGSVPPPHAAAAARWRRSRRRSTGTGCWPGSDK